LQVENDIVCVVGSEKENKYVYTIANRRECIIGIFSLVLPTCNRSSNVLGRELGS